MTTPLSFFRRFGALLALLFTLAAPGWAMTAAELQTKINENPGRVITVSKTVVISADAEIDGKGCTVTFPGLPGKKGNVLAILAGKVKIRNLTINSTIYSRNHDYGGMTVHSKSPLEVTLGNCTFTGTGTGIQARVGEGHGG